MKNIPWVLLLLLLQACANPASNNAVSPEAPVPQANTVPEPATTPAPVPAPAVQENKSNVAPKSTTPKPAPPPAPAEAGTPQPVAAPAEPVKAPEKGLRSWDELLQAHVSAAGNVNYKGFAADKTALRACLQALSDNPPQNSWSNAEKMAFWINAYNAFTISLIVDNYPVRSIMNLDGGKTWDVKRIDIGGKKYSLNDIENNILRPQFKDARIHFVINCAARSCPPLYNRAITAANLETVLDERTRQFVNNPKFNTLGADKCSISKIFEWYAADFGNLRAYLSRYGRVQIPDSATIEYRDYNWDLNE